MFKGSLVAIVTPFKNGELDEQALRDLIEFHIASGTNGIVPCGTTGESATLSHTEHKRVIEITIDAVKGRVPVLAGTGSNSTEEAIRLTKHAKDVGADGALMITPYYNKPTQDGLYHHFKSVASEVEIPIILYNVPSRTGVNMLPETVAKLSQMDSIIGIKEATGSLQQVSDVIGLSHPEFIVLSGDDFIVLPMLSVGGKGVISVIANIVPKDMSDLIKAFNEGDMEKALELHYKLRPLNDAMFYETNPIPVKKALVLMNKVEDEIRLPLVLMSEKNTARLKTVMKNYGLIS